MTQVITMMMRVEDYVSERRRLGFGFTAAAYQLRSFARFVDEAGHVGPLTTRIVLDWVKNKSRNSTRLTWARRLNLVRTFATYVTQFEPATECPSEAIFGRPTRRLTPHIYTDKEIVDLLAAARNMPPVGTLCPGTFETFFGLIAATGLRRSEALNLSCGDVDLEGRCLTIRMTKFRKSRYVPIHATVVAALERYLALRARSAVIAPGTPLFSLQSGARLPSWIVQDVFRRLRAKLGWVARGGHTAVRIHDLRHTFICHRVQLWHESGTDIDNAIAALSTYVGHAKVSDTYWYLTAVPELMAIAGNRFEEFAANVRDVAHG